MVKAEATSLEIKHEHSLPEPVMKTINPVFQDLLNKDDEDDLPKRCFHERQTKMKLLIVNLAQT